MNRGNLKGRDWRKKRNKAMGKAAKKQRAQVVNIEGDWCVVSGEKITACQSNAHAWKLADKINNEPMNRQEEVHDWSAHRVS